MLRKLTPTFMTQALREREREREFIHVLAQDQTILVTFKTDSRGLT